MKLSDRPIALGLMAVDCEVTYTFIHPATLRSGYVGGNVCSLSNVCSMLGAGACTRGRARGQRACDTGGRGRAGYSSQHKGRPGRAHISQPKRRQSHTNLEPTYTFIHPATLRSGYVERVFVERVFVPSFVHAGSVHARAGAWQRARDTGRARAGRILFAQLGAGGQRPTRPHTQQTQAKQNA